MAVIWQLAHGRTLELGPTARIMGILNVTPDSFSDGGDHSSVAAAVAAANRMIEDGANIIDVGGESTRPGADPVSASEEMRRVLPVVEALAREDILLSIDTYRAETADAALKAGAHVVNDVKGLAESGMAAVIARHRAGLVVMHNSRLHEPLTDPVADQRAVFERAVAKAKAAGVGDTQIVFDPGIGFGKDAEENWALLVRLSEIRSFGPLLLGTSRKRFLGALTGREAKERDVATAATSVAGRLAGVDLFRVHDVAVNREALLVADRMLRERR